MPDLRLPDRAGWPPISDSSSKEGKNGLLAGNEGPTSGW